MAKYVEGTIVTITAMGNRYRNWKSKMQECNFPAYIYNNARFRGGYYDQYDCDQYLYKVVSSFENGKYEIVYHIESLLSSHIIKTDPICHILIGEKGITEYGHV